MDVLFPDRAGDNLHGSRAVVAPSPCLDSAQATAASREQRRMPSEKTFGCERVAEMTRRVQHHFDNPLDVAVGGHEGADVHP